MEEEYIFGPRRAGRCGRGLTPEGHSMSFTSLPRVGYDVTTSINANGTQHFILSTSVGVDIISL